MDNVLHYFIETEFQTKQSPCPKPLVQLGGGDPKKEHGFPFPDIVGDIVIDVIKTGMHDCYTNESGDLAAKKAIVEKFSKPENPFDISSVFMSWGCSGALFNAVSVLCEHGSNILLPSPGYPLSLAIT